MSSVRTRPPAGEARNHASRGIWKQFATTLRARARLRRQQAMRARKERLKYVTSEQLAYARALELGVRAGRFVLIITFAIYAFGLAAPKVPLSDLSLYWSMPVSEYLRAANAGTGWGWLSLVGHGDYMNFVGIAALAGLTAVCYLRVLPFSLRRREFVFVAILLLEIGVLALAASGLLAAGH